MYFAYLVLYTGPILCCWSHFLVSARTLIPRNHWQPDFPESWVPGSAENVWSQIQYVERTIRWFWNRVFSKTFMLTQRNKDADSSDTLKFYYLFDTSAALRHIFNVSLLNDLQVYSSTEMKGFIINLSPCAVGYCAFFNTVNINRKVFCL